jgi:PPIC-type peptidyl-prolyl cis-trans isomerase-like protein
MRRVGLAVLIVASALTGCSSFRDVFSSHAETAARVGSRQLKSAYVAEIISRVGGPQANPEAAEVVTNIWVDIALFGDRVGRGTLKPDSALLERLLWPQLAQNRSGVWHDTIVARRAGPGAAAVDSAYRAEGVRLFQHILVSATGSTAADTAKAKATAERLLPQARSGNFGKLAAQNSSDPGSKADSGFLPPGPKGAFVPEFDSVAWSLKPGEVSGVVKTQFGFHIIRRPPLNEVSDRMLTVLKQTQSAVQDSIYFVQLTEKNEVAVKSGAPAAIRSALSDLGAARKSGKVLVSYRNGSFTVADFARWMGALGPQQIGQIRQANDTLLVTFLKNLAQNTILLREADSAKIAVNPQVYAGLAAQYTELFTGLKQAIGLDGPEFSDSSKTPVAERVKLAGQKVDEYFDKLTKGQAQFRQIPPTLSAELRSQGDFKIYQAGIARAVELVVAKRRTDSLAGKLAPPPPAPGSLQPAPGGPPTPGKKP